MNIIAADTAPPHFFLVGFRAPPGQVFDENNPNAQQVGTLILRSRVAFDGTPVDPGVVLTEDEPYQGFPESGPLRLESEIAAWKPEPDVVVVDRLESILDATQQADLGPPPNTEAIANHLEASNFGTVEVNRGSGFGLPVARRYGWRERGRPTRLGQAGRPGVPNDPSDPASLANFDADSFELPDLYENGVQSGQPLPGEGAFAPDDRLRFTGAGEQITLAIPLAPVLAVSQDGKPLDPPLTPVPLVDTVVMDRAVREFTMVWRATFRWEARFEAATLEIA